eukprot:12353290-Alexandrium_andersonii.AAC.1
MSASLVGSEMCIRDRSSLLTAQLARPSRSCGRPPLRPTGLGQAPTTSLGHVVARRQVAVGYVGGGRSN